MHEAVYRCDCAVYKFGTVRVAAMMVSLIRLHFILAETATFFRYIPISVRQILRSA